MIGNQVSLRFTVYGIRDVLNGCKIRPQGLPMARPYFWEACVFYRYCFYFQLPGRQPVRKHTFSDHSAAKVCRMGQLFNRSMQLLVLATSIVDQHFSLFWQLILMIRHSVTNCSGFFRMFTQRGSKLLSAHKLAYLLVHTCFIMKPWQWGSNLLPAHK